MTQTTALVNTKQKVKYISSWDLFLVCSLSEMTVVMEIP